MPFWCFLCQAQNLKQYKKGRKKAELLLSCNRMASRKRSTAWPRTKSAPLVLGRNCLSSHTTAASFRSSRHFPRDCTPKSKQAVPLSSPGRWAGTVKADVHAASVCLQPGMYCLDAPNPKVHGHFIWTSSTAGCSSVGRMQMLWSLLHLSLTVAWAQKVD